MSTSEPVARPTDSQSECSPGGACENTDRHLWPQVSERDAPHESIHVTASGGIGINVGGLVIVKPLREWHRLALAPVATFQPLKSGSKCTHCGGIWLPMPGGSIYHECHT